MLALEAWRLSHCPGCGQTLSECTDEENDGNYQVIDIRCHACAAMTHFSAKFKEDTAASAVRYRVTKRTG